MCVFANRAPPRVCFIDRCAVSHPSRPTGGTGYTPSRIPGYPKPPALFSGASQPPHPTFVGACGSTDPALLLRAPPPRPGDCRPFILGGSASRRPHIKKFPPDPGSSDKNKTSHHGVRDRTPPPAAPPLYQPLPQFSKGVGVMGGALRIRRTLFYSVARRVEQFYLSLVARYEPPTPRPSALTAHPFASSRPGPRYTS